MLGGYSGGPICGEPFRCILCLNRRQPNISPHADYSGGQIVVVFGGRAEHPQPGFVQEKGKGVLKLP